MTELNKIQAVFVPFYLLCTHRKQPLDLTHNLEIPFDLLKRWRLAGINHESANEVYEYLARNAPELSQIVDSIEDPNLIAYRNKLSNP